MISPKWNKYETLIVSRDDIDDGLLRVSLNRPHVLNAVSLDMVSELHDLFDSIHQITNNQLDFKDLRLRTMLLEMRGGCVGVDVATADSSSSWEYTSIQSQALLSSLIERLYRLPLVVICIIDGPIVGLGLGLCLASDLRVATSRSSFCCGFNQLGISNCDMGVSWLLPRVVGTPKATLMMLVGDSITAEEAEECGLIHYLSSDHAVAIRQSIDLAVKMKARHSWWGLSLTKKQLKTSLETGTSMGQAILAENMIQTYLLSRDDVMARAKATLARLKSKTSSKL